MFTEVAFVQGKGGASKTTSSVNIATAIARQAPQSLVGFCDLDTNQGATDCFQRHPIPNIKLVSSPQDAVRVGCGITLIDTEGKSMVSQVIASLPETVGMFIIPCGPDFLDIKGAEKTIAAVRQRRPNANVRLLWTRVFTGRSKGSDPERLAEVAARLGVKPFVQKIEHSTAYGAAQELGWEALKSSHKRVMESLAMEIMLAR